MISGRFCRLLPLVFIILPVVVGARDLPVRTEFSEGFPTIEELQIVAIDGTTIAGEEFLGQAVAFVFLKPSCSKCTVKLPGVDTSYQTFKDEGFKVIAVSSGGDREPLESTQRRYGFDWVWAKNHGELRSRLENKSAFEIVIYDMAGIPRFRIGENDSNWKVHLELCLGAAIERPLDLSAFPQGYVGSAVCGICHQAEWEQWLETPHANSMQTLRKQQNHVRLDCVVCHVTGEAGKDSRPWRMTPRELQEVGCEECHGPGGPHRTTPFPGEEVHSIEEASCVRCHDQKNSPDWDYKTYLAQVVHTALSEQAPADSGAQSEKREEAESEADLKGDKVNGSEEEGSEGTEESESDQEESEEVEDSSPESDSETTDI